MGGCGRTRTPPCASATTTSFAPIHRSIAFLASPRPTFRLALPPSLELPPMAVHDRLHVCMCAQLLETLYADDLRLETGHARSLKVLCLCA
jgi:hypothetical protein